MTLGAQLIDELARRGQLGMYFEYADYRRLRRIDAMEDLRHFLNRRGFATSEAISNVVDAADILGRYPQASITSTLLLTAPFEAIGWSVLALPFWLFSMLLCATSMIRTPKLVPKSSSIRDKTS